MNRQPLRLILRHTAPALLVALNLTAANAAIPSAEAIDRKVQDVMAATQANGLAIAVIDQGKVGFVRAFGKRNAKGDPLTTDTIMYGASLTKTVFAYTVLTLVDQGKLDLDRPIGKYLDRPLVDYGPDPVFPDKYGPYKDLAGDSRWERITPRHCLTHATGFSNFWFLEPDKKLRIHFEPGSRFSYSGEGLILLQFAIEHSRAPHGEDVGTLTNSLFTRLGMTRTSLTWRPDFAANAANGWNDLGEPQEHDGRSKVRAAGSMDTTISDIARFAAALVRGDGLSAASRAEMTKRQLHITTAHQFPLFGPELAPEAQRPDLYAGLGVVAFDGPQGHGFFKGGHDEQTANTLVCLEAQKRCLVILANDVRAEAGFAALAKFILGDSAVPYDWEYGDTAGKS